MQNMISIKLLCSFIETTFRHGCSPVNLLHIFRTPFAKNIPEGLLLHVITSSLSNSGADLKVTSDEHVRITHSEANIESIPSNKVNKIIKKKQVPEQKRHWL